MSSRDQVYEAAARVVLFQLTGRRDELEQAIVELAKALNDNASRAHTRSTDPKTSRDAAPRAVTKSQALVIRAMRRGPFTDHELATHLQGIMSPSGVRSRRAELVRRGLVIGTGTTRMHNNRKHTVWALANTGAVV